MSLLDLQADVKLHLKITESVDDTVLQAKLDAAETYVSRQTGGTGTLASSSVTESVYGRGMIAVTKTPMLSLTSVTGDQVGALSISDLAVNLSAGVIRPKPNTWLLTSDYYTCVYTSGYASAAAVPDDLVEAVRLMTQHFYGTQRGPGKGTGGSPGTEPDAFTRAQQILDGIGVGSFA